MVDLGRWIIPEEGKDQECMVMAQVSRPRTQLRGGVSDSRYQWPNATGSLHNVRDQILVCLSASTRSYRLSVSFLMTWFSFSSWSLSITNLVLHQRSQSLCLKLIVQKWPKATQVIRTHMCQHACCAKRVGLSIWCARSHFYFQPHHVLCHSAIIHLIETALPWSHDKVDWLSTIPTKNYN